MLNLWIVPIEGFVCYLSTQKLSEPKGPNDETYGIVDHPAS